MLTDGVPLIDHHCHGVVTKDLDQPGFEALLTEAGVAHPGRSTFESLVGTAVLRWCAPVLELEPFPTPEHYLARRAELGWREASRRLLRAAGVEAWLVDTGSSSLPLTTVDELAEIDGHAVHEILRLEDVLESVASDGVDAGALPRAVRDEVYERSGTVVGLKSVVAYRSGLAIPANAPSTMDVINAADKWLRDGGGRVSDPVLLGWLVHLGAGVGAELGLPLQLHTGFGDPDLHLHRSDPLLLTDFLNATKDSGVTVMLLHGWPFHRNASYLAHVFPHVHVDVGLAVPHVGARADTVIGELLELAPFAAVCYSSDGYGLPELHYLGALLWRRGVGRLVDHWLDESVMSPAGAERLISGMAFGNTERVYRRL